MMSCWICLVDLLSIPQNGWMEYQATSLFWYLLMPKRKLHLCLVQCNAIRSDERHGYVGLFFFAGGEFQSLVDTT